MSYLKCPFIVQQLSLLQQYMYSLCSFYEGLVGLLCTVGILSKPSCSNTTKRPLA